MGNQFLTYTYPCACPYPCQYPCPYPVMDRLDPDASRIFKLPLDQVYGLAMNHGARRLAVRTVMQGPARDNAPWRRDKRDVLVVFRVTEDGKLEPQTVSVLYDDRSSSNPPHKCLAWMGDGDDTSEVAVLDEIGTTIFVVNVDTNTLTEIAATNPDGSYFAPAGSITATKDTIVVQYVTVGTWIGILRRHGTEWTKETRLLDTAGRTMSMCSVPGTARIIGVGCKSCDAISFDHYPSDHGTIWMLDLVSDRIWYCRLTRDSEDSYFEMCPIWSCCVQPVYSPDGVSTSVWVSVTGPRLGIIQVPVDEYLFVNGAPWVVAVKNFVRDDDDKSVQTRIGQTFGGCLCVVADVGVFLYRGGDKVEMIRVLK